MSLFFKEHSTKAKWVAPKRHEIGNHLSGIGIGIILGIALAHYFPQGPEPTDAPRVFIYMAVAFAFIGVGNLLKKHQ